MSVRKQLLALSLMFAASAADPNLFSCPHISKGIEYKKSKDLPLWSFDGKEVHAKDAKTAIKYAKKRGFYNGKEPVRVV